MGMQSVHACIVLPSSMRETQVEMHSAKKNMQKSWLHATSPANQWKSIIKLHNLLDWRKGHRIFLSYDLGKITWKRTKWIRYSRRPGRLNQKRSSVGWTTGIPFTTSPRSIIRTAIFVIITWSFVPTRRIICKYSYSLSYPLLNREQD